MPLHLLKQLHHLPITRYFWIALTGFVLDCGVFALLNIGLGTPPMPANIVSGITGVTFVYFTSARRIFFYKGKALWPKFMAYLVYQACGIILFSGLIAWLSGHFQLPAFGVKVGIVPGQFILNYLVLRTLLRLFEPSRA